MHNSTMNLGQLFDQNQFINPGLPLSGHSLLVPDVNNSWAEQALTVESAQLHAKFDLLQRSYQDFAQHNRNPLSAYDDPNHARLGQGRQGGTLRSINDVNIQPHQELKWVQEFIRSNQHVFQPLAPSGGAHFTNGANILYGTPAVPATMVMSARTGNGGSFKYHDHFGLQVANTDPPSDGLVQLGRSPASSTDVGGTAYGSFFYNFCPLNWATAFDVSVPRPTAQAVVNIVTPYTGYGHDDGGTPVGAAVGVAASSAPGPTRGAYGTGTALSESDRSDTMRCHRSPHRCVGYDQTHLRVPTRRTTQPSRSRATRGPVVQFEADTNTLATRLLNEGADSTAVELLSTQVFNNEVSAKALTVKSICREQSTSTSGTRSKYRSLLADVERKDGSKGYGCLLCPQDRRKEYKNPQDSIRHLRKAHFGIAESCVGGCGRLFYRRSEMNQHRKKYCHMNIDGCGAPAGPSVSNI